MRYQKYCDKIVNHFRIHSTRTLFPGIKRELPLWSRRSMTSLKKFCPNISSIITLLRLCVRYKFEAHLMIQLNMYDFHKARHDNNENEFKHRLFKRGQKYQHVFRLTLKTTAWGYKTKNNGPFTDSIKSVGTSDEGIRS